MISYMGKSGSFWKELEAMSEKYVTPEVEFVEMEEDVIATSKTCDGYIYGDGCTGY